jgi:peroxiredoxin
MRVSLLPFLLILVLVAACKEGAPPASSPAAAAAGDDVLKPGGPVPALVLHDLDGKERSLSEFKGKTVLVNFWATWCNPCVAEMPALERLHQTLKDKGFLVVAVSVDTAQQKPKVVDFVREKGLTFPVLVDLNFKSATALGVSGFPETFFLDREGKFRSFTDPVAKKAAVRVISDRPWDSPQYIAAVSELLR